MSSNLSPEEILRMKEMEGGHTYDPDHLVQRDVTADNIKTEQNQDPVIPQVSNDPIQPNQQVQQIQIQQEPAKNAVYELGWKNLPMHILPSKGMFYPDGTRIAIRAAEVKEIRHFSTIDEDDRIDIEEKLGMVLDSCMRIDFPGEGVVSFKDLKVEDRFFVVLAIRDLTFTRGENMIILIPDTECGKKDCPIKEGFELRTGVLSSYSIDEKILKYYDKSERCFVFEIKKTGKKVKMGVPSIGIANKISDFIVHCSNRKIEIDESFLRILPFILEEWRTTTNDSILSLMEDSNKNWTKEEFSIYFELSEMIKIGTKTKAQIDCPKCGAKEVTADISFPGGIRSLFLISDIFSELL
jgi:dimeric dUTPase (all-alpha-NTP-PPase superfamily)